MQRSVNHDRLVVKVALRAADCRWWSFADRRFEGPSVHAAGARARRKARTACAVAPTWKQATSVWTPTGVTGTLALGGALPRGRYALRLRVKNDTTVLVERVTALTVK